MWKNDYQVIMSEAEKLLKINPDRREMYALAWLGAFAAEYNLGWPSGLEMKPDELVQNLVAQLLEAEQHDRLAQDFQRKAGNKNHSESKLFSLLARSYKKRAGELHKARATWEARAGRVLGPEESGR